jgi:hypothetical protein
MIPGKIFNYTSPRCAAHLLDDFGMPVQMFERRRDRVNVSR